MKKGALGKRIFQFKTATDEEIIEYCELLDIKTNVDLIRSVANGVTYYSKFLDHYKKFGERVTVEKFNSRPTTTDHKKIREHYGVAIEQIQRPNIYNADYISARDGISIEEAKQYIKEYKANKATSKENFIKKYGADNGMIRYNSWYNSSLKKGVDSSDASNSKRHRAYYLKRGHSEEQSKSLATAYNKENSPMHLEYYIKRGLSLDYARKKIRAIHDKKIGKDGYREKLELAGYSTEEINKLIKFSRGNCSRKKLGDKGFEERILKARQTFEKNGHWIPLKDMSDYSLYRRAVWYYTNVNSLHEMKHHDKRGLAGVYGAYQLDHKYSIQQGYINGISPELIGSAKNLEFIPWEENAKKQSACSIEIEELHEYEN